MEKKCTSCNKTKDISEFNKNRTRKDGRDNICRACRKFLYRNRIGRTPRSSIEDFTTQELLDELRRRGELPQPDEQTPTQ